MTDDVLPATTGSSTTAATDTADPPKPGIRTTEFWLTVLASVLGILMASGVVVADTPWARVIGGAITFLSTLGYTWKRSDVKAAYHRLVPLFLVGALLGTAACATVKSAGESALIDCGKPALSDAVASIASDVQCFLTGGAVKGGQCVTDASVDWQAELDEYAARGREALACAVAKVGVALAGSTPKPVMASAVVTPPDRAAYYLMSRHLQPKNVQR